MSLHLAEEVIARQTPETQAIIRTVLAERDRVVAGQGGKNGVGSSTARRLNTQTPQNSSLPPSTQHPHAKPAPRKPKSKKKRGGQPGHQKHQRLLISSAECDDVQTLEPTECRPLWRESDVCSEPARCLAQAP